jgi:glycosyltransferase involved in cell wall biosynthesis
VYNGADYVGEAIGAILDQTFEDLELIISDNGSDDATEEICRDAAARDRRVRYVRSEVNRGAAWNFNRVVELARGDLFRWAAHDDLVRPTHLERCVEALGAQPSAVLAHTRVEIIDSSGDSHGTYVDRVLDTSSPDPVRRFSDLAGGHRCFEVFGLIRTSALRSIPPLGAYGHADGVLLSRLGLLGPFVAIDEPLFAQRMHDRQSMNVYGRHSGQEADLDGPPDYHAYAAWYDPSKSGRAVYPHWRLLLEHYRSVLVTPGVSVRDRLVCAVRLVGWIRHSRHWLRHDVRLGLERLATRTRALVPDGR